MNAGKNTELAIMATYDRDLEAWMERLQQDALVYNRRQMILPLLLIGAAATAAWYGICGTYSLRFSACHDGIAVVLCCVQLPGITGQPTNVAHPSACYAR